MKIECLSPYKYGRSRGLQNGPSVCKRELETRAGTVGGLQPVGTATAPNRLENFTTLNRYDDILTVVERM